ncbi:MAG: UDP-N-acetylmuramoyl-tripeptide--D-alanyl-D-alanine ligase [Gammaproteobacteria bacterium]|nr:UDP-N-acetylmuramoyl-tripeptide--D-alanyl-D-alanine ligase [Gammaproteobacteria bacterium]
MAEGIQLTLNQAAQWLGAQLHNAGTDSEFLGVSTDSRTIEAGMLFIALKGPNHDGHQHIASVAKSGAAAVLVEREVETDLPQLIVEDTRLALGRLASCWRSHLDVSVVAVTGSNGKTTVKEMLASVLSLEGNTLATHGNLNNDIGMPLTLLRLSEQHRYAVIEMGANHPAEIAYLTLLAKPDVALITNAAAAHLEGFGSVEGVAHAKGEIFQGLGESGVAVINADDDYASLWLGLAAEHARCTFGLGPNADVTAQWEATATGIALSVKMKEQSMTIQLPLPGRHNVMNALATCAAARAMGASLDFIKQGLENMQAVKGRLQACAGLNGSKLIDDTYNANPASLHAGLEVLAACSGQRFMALGDMAELGDDAAQWHDGIGREARKMGIERLYATGDLSQNASEAFGEAGYFFSRQDDLVDALRPELTSDVTVLVKGSRSMHMERVVEALSAGGEG